jgi:hypothetical protein
MRRAYQCSFLVLILLLGTKVSAQTDSKEPSGVIAGRITVEGGPVPGVTVMVATGTSFRGSIAGRATTDDQGNYKITGLAAGDYTINPFAPAFYYPSPFNGTRGKTLSLSDGETVEGLDFKLIRGGVIGGKITDSAGKPVVEERVQLSLFDENRQRSTSPPMPFTPYNLMTDDRGIYRIFGLEPGRYLVSVGRDVRPGFISTGGPPRFYPRTYYPNVTEESQAQIVELAPGGEAASVDIVLGKTAVGYSARGRVVNADTGQPVPGVMVAYGSPRPDGGMGATGYSSNSQTDARGEFRIDAVTPGRYAAFAVPLNDGDFYSDQGPFEIIEGDVEGVQIVVHHGGSITGVVTVEGASDPAIITKLAQLSLIAHNLQGTSGMFGFPKPVAPDGSFRFTGLSPGKTMISLVNPNQAVGFSIARIEVDGNDESGGVDVGAGQQVTGVRVVLSYGPGVIHGRVKCQVGSLPESAMLGVSFWNTATPRSSIQGARVDSRGQFAISGLADGEYELTLMVMTSPPSRRTQPLKQNVTVTEGVAPEVVFVLDLSGQK